MISVELNRHRALVRMIEDKYRGDQIYKAIVMGININGNIATVHINLSVYNAWWVESAFRLELSESGPSPSSIHAKLREIVIMHKAPEQEDQIESEVMGGEITEELRKELRGRITDLTPGYRWHVIARDERQSVELAFLRIDTLRNVAEVFSDDAITSMLYSLSVGRRLEAERTIDWLNSNNLWTGGKLHLTPEEKGRAEHGGVQRNNSES